MININKTDEGTTNSDKKKQSTLQEWIVFASYLGVDQLLVRTSRLSK